ncbi:hypothetical protein KJ855_04865 [Patescibacteria group bacterium]|nr:hypothetical protein [Patescibacteria group bacterium]
MKITFLGTSAATSYPLPFCRCDVCRKARKLGGKDFRKRSSLLINDDLLIDFGPDIMAASFMHDISIADVRYCLQTHTHSDHFDASHLITRLPDYAVADVPHLDIFASKATFQNMSNKVEQIWESANLLGAKFLKDLNVDIHPVKPLQSFTAGDYQITAFASDHEHNDDSLIYAIQEGDKTILYGSDTVSFPSETWNGFQQNNLQFDIAILDHTYGPDIDGDGHLNTNQFIEHIQKMKKDQLATTNTRFLATHISHEGNPVHNKLSKSAAQQGYEIAYDGLEIII